MLATSTYHLRLAFDEGVLWHPPVPPVICVSRWMGVCCAGHHLHLSFASRVGWGCALARWSRLTIDGGVLC